MDPNNQKALDVLVKEGEKKFKDPKDPKRQLSYAEMRALYG